MASDQSVSWTRFYTEFAGRLLKHKCDRTELVAKVREVCNNLGHGYLDNSATADPDTGLLDICPFTVMGTFNRGISDANRKAIASELALFLGVNEPVPDDFSGIPTLNNLSSVVFWELRFIDPLWRVLEDAITLVKPTARLTDSRLWNPTHAFAMSAASVGSCRLGSSGHVLTDTCRWTTVPRSTLEGVWA